MAFWAVVDLCILAAGVVSIAASVIYRKPDLLMNMVLTHAHLTAGLALGISMLICFAVSIAAIVQVNHVTIGLVILNYFLVAEAIVVLVIGSFVWFPTLTERAVFHNAWLALSQDDRITLQDRVCSFLQATYLTLTVPSSSAAVATSMPQTMPQSGATFAPKLKSIFLAHLTLSTITTPTFSACHL